MALDTARLAAELDAIVTESGTTVQFGTLWNGSPRCVSAIVAAGDPQLDLESGGFQSPIQHVITVSKTSLPTAPELKSLVVIDGKNFRVITVQQHFGPMSQEWIVEVGNP